MQYRLLSEEPKTYALIFETGDELATGLGRFATEQKLAGSSFKAIGAFSSVKLAGSIGRQRSISRRSYSTNRSNCYRWSATLH
jgi:predicted DNA-binding protein with PD1-like motif